MSKPDQFRIVSDTRQTVISFDTVPLIAKLQRHLNLAVVINGFVLSLLADIGGQISIWFKVLAYLAAVIFTYVTWIQLASILRGKKWAVAYAALMIVPVVNGIALLVLSRSATRRLEQEGIRVGFLGASSDEVQRWVKVQQTQCVHCGYEADKTNAIACKHCKRQVHQTCRKEHVADAHAQTVPNSGSSKKTKNKAR